MIYLFDGFEDAERYGVGYVQAHPAMFCRIYDHRGTAEGLFKEVFAPHIAEREFGAKASWRKLRNGLAQTALGVFCVWFDWWLGGPVILGVVVGSKFLTTGVVRLVQGVAGLLEGQ